LYPGIVFLASLAVTIFILTYAIPRISVYLQAMGRPLPPMTQRLVDLSDLLVTQWPMIVGGAVLAGVLSGVTYAAPVGRLLIDSIVLRIPLVGYILRTGATAAFSRSMSILLSSGVTIIESLRTCQDLHRNRRLAITIARAREQIIGGDALAPSFRSGSFADVAFMPMLAGMIAAGEKSGRLDQTLVECATFHEQRLASLIRVLSSVIEVAVVVFVGGIVGYVYLAFMVALYGAAL
jgi:type IV pilus assembly protein PilC